MKKKIDDYDSLIQMLRDFKIDEKEAAKTILSRLRSGRPKSTFNLDIYFGVTELMNKKKISRQSAIINFLKGRTYSKIKKKYNIKIKNIMLLVFIRFLEKWKVILSYLRE